MSTDERQARGMIVERIKQSMGREASIACDLLFEFLSQQEAHNQLRTKGVPDDVVDKSFADINRRLVATYSNALHLPGWQIKTKTRKGQDFIEDTEIEFGQWNLEGGRVFDFRQYITLTKD